MDLLAILALVSSLSEPASLPERWEERGIASMFRPGKGGHNGGDVACLWRLPRRKRRISHKLRFVAHRRWRCGTVVLLHLPRTGRSTYAVVLDKGPYGARDTDGKWVLKMRRSDPGRWRGVVDLSPGAAEALGHDGWDRVQMTRVAVDELPES